MCSFKTRKYLSTLLQNKRKKRKLAKFWLALSFISSDSNALQWAFLMLSITTQERDFFLAKVEITNNHGQLPKMASAARETSQIATARLVCQMMPCLWRPEVNLCRATKKEPTNCYDKFGNRNRGRFLLPYVGQVISIPVRMHSCWHERQRPGNKFLFS